MKDFLDQIKKALGMNLYYLALFASLTIPDICGAMSSENGEATKQKYIDWFEKYVAKKYMGILKGEDCYYYRCSALHQGSSQNPKSKFSRILFIEPNAISPRFHCNAYIDEINYIFNIDIQEFCNDIISGVQDWIQENKNTESYKKNYDKFMRRYPDGFPPFIRGVPVIS